MDRGAKGRMAAGTRDCNRVVRRRASGAEVVEVEAARTDRAAWACLKMVRWNILRR